MIKGSEDFCNLSSSVPRPSHSFNDFCDCFRFFFKKIDFAEFYNFLGIQFKGSEKGRLTVEL